MRVSLKSFLSLLCMTGISLLGGQSVFAIDGARVLTLQDAVDAGVKNDPWLEKSAMEESALHQRASAAKPLPEPSLKFGVLNVPTDTFDLDQEPMTQLKASVALKIPRGNTRSLKSQKLIQQAAIHPISREARKSELIRRISFVWLEGWFAQQSRDLLVGNRYLFDELRTITTSNYNSGFGASRQQDLILADLELTTLDEKILKFEQQFLTARESLSQWLFPADSDFHFAELYEVPGKITSADDPDLSVDNHPSLMEIKQKQSVANTRVALERQGDKPDWGVELGYSHRLDAQDGSDRADFVSLGFSTSLPSFNKARTGGLIAAARHEREMLSSDYELQKRKFLSELRQALMTRDSVGKRLTLYNDVLIQQLQFRTEAITNAYTSDSVRFEEVMRAQLKELNSKLEVISLKFQQSRAQVLINFYLTSMDKQVEES